MKTITIIGSGFAGLTAIRTIRKYHRDIQINVISPHPILNYLPSLIWVPSGQATKEDIQIPLDNFLDRNEVHYLADEVVGLAKVVGLAAGVVGLTQNTQTSVLTKSGQTIESDCVIIASGGRFIKKLPGIEHSITPCEGLAAANAIKDKLKNLEGGTIAIGFSGNPKEPQAMRGGPMFEFLFSIDSQLRQEKRRDKFKLVFFTPASKPGARLGEKAVKALLAEMKKRDIQTHLGHKIKAFTQDKVITEGAEFEADMILFMPGMTGNIWFDKTQLARSEGGLLQADKFCQTSTPNVFVAGDAGSFPGPEWMPKQAHMADLQAEAAAKNALLSLENKPASHTFKVELMCIVDSLNKGMLVKRDEKGMFILPSSRLFHYAKKLLAWRYLRQYK